VRIHVDLAYMPPHVQTAVRQLLDALTQAWPGPLGEARAADEGGLPTPPTCYPRPKKGTVSYIRPRILEVLERHPQGLSPEEIRRQLGLKQRLNSTLKTMWRCGLVHRPVDGLYVIRKQEDAHD
jgi:hypothetical protein